MNGMYANARILIVDDDEDDFIITSGYMRSVPGNSFIIDWAPTYKGGIEQLAANAYDLYFVDYRLGAKSGVDFLKEANKMHCDAPIVLLTGQGNYEVDIEAMQLGAVDYLIKAELNNEKIERCIRYALERANTMKALRSSEAKYRGIFEKSKDIIFVANGLMELLEVNEAVFTLLGIGREAAIGRSLLEFMEKKDGREYVSNATQKGAAIIDYPIALTRVDGVRVYCTLTLSIEKDNNDDNYIQGIIHDITGLKKAEQATVQTEKIAATSRLLRALAHEIRNPLNNIMMSVEHMFKDLEEEDRLLFLDIIKRGSIRINTLINELLHSAHPNDSIQEAHPFHIILDDVIDAANDRVTLKKMLMDISRPNEQIVIMADRENLKLALLNIIINAIEAMEEGSGRLAIILEQAGEKAILKISDNGCGISEENVSRIFEPYFTKKKTGAGLGLAFTLNILNVHNAMIDVASKVGTGTTFTLTFPLA